jgi:hypothetical protein
MQEVNEQFSEVPTASEIVDALGVALHGYEGGVEGITIERATPHQYMVRVYDVEGGDYESRELRFD